jgi:hypothetical protein
MHALLLHMLTISVVLLRMHCLFIGVSVPLLLLLQLGMLGLVLPHLQLLLGTMRPMMVLWPLLLLLPHWCCWILQKPIARRQLRQSLLAHVLLRHILRCRSIIAVAAIVPLAVRICRARLHLVPILQLTAAPLL